MNTAKILKTHTCINKLIISENSTGGMYFFVYTGALVLWIMSVNNFQFITNISETMCPTNIYHISFYSASAPVCCIKIHAEIKELLQVKD